MENSAWDGYRHGLVQLEQKSQESYDKTLVALSGGALGLSLTFITDIVTLKTAQRLLWLEMAWVFWALSLLFILFSFETSRWALRKAIHQVDQGEQPGGFWDKLTEAFNVLSGLTFITGVGSILIFIHLNL